MMIDFFFDDISYFVKFLGCCFFWLGLGRGDRCDGQQQSVGDADGGAGCRDPGQRQHDPLPLGFTDRPRGTEADQREAGRRLGAGLERELGNRFSGSERSRRRRDPGGEIPSGDRDGSLPASQSENDHLQLGRTASRDREARGGLAVADRGKHREPLSRRPDDKLVSPLRAVETTAKQIADDD